MLFSVIIPTWNRLSYLPSTLDSVWRQTFKDYEVIIIDDGSTDGTVEYLRSIGSAARVIAQANGGAGLARNRGVAAALGEYIAFLDSDDLWFPWTLEVFKRAILQCSRPSILSASVCEFQGDSTPTISWSSSAIEYERFADYLAAFATGYYVGGNRAVIRRDAFHRVGGFVSDRINGEDHDLTLRLGIEPGFVQILQPVTLCWRRHGESSTGDIKKAIEGAKHLIKKEKCGVYPGGGERRLQRQTIILRHVRPVAIECVKQAASAEGWSIYLASLWWHLMLWRWKFLLGFPLKLLLSVLFAQRSDCTRESDQTLARENP